LENLGPHVLPNPEPRTRSGVGSSNEREFYHFPQVGEKQRTLSKKAIAAQFGR
jgi:hypothetical protein